MPDFWPKGEISDRFGPIFGGGTGILSSAAELAWPKPKDFDRKNVAGNSRKQNIKNQVYVEARRWHQRAVKLQFFAQNCHSGHCGPPPLPRLQTA